MTMKHKITALAFVALSVTAASSAAQAQAQVNAASGGVTWSVAPTLLFQGAP